MWGVIIMGAGAVTSPFPPFMVLLFTCEFWGAVLPLMTIPRPRNNKKPKTHPKPKDNGGCLWVSVGYWCLSFLGLGVVWVFFRAFTLTPNPQVKRKTPNIKITRPLGVAVLVVDLTLTKEFHYALVSHVVVSRH